MTANLPTPNQWELDSCPNCGYPQNHPWGACTDPFHGKSSPDGLIGTLTQYANGEHRKNCIGYGEGQLCCLELPDILALIAAQVQAAEARGRKNGIDEVHDALFDQGYLETENCMQVIAALGDTHE